MNGMHGEAFISVIWRPAWAPLTIYVAAALLAVLAMFIYARTFKARPFLSSWLLIMRLAVIASLAFVLMGPSHIPSHAQHAVRPKLCVLLDTSESMLTPDCTGASRMRFALEHWLSLQRLQELSAQYELSIHGFDEQLRPLSISAVSNSAMKDQSLATGRATHVASCVTQLVQRISANSNRESVLLISDGRETTEDSIEHAAIVAKSHNIPVHTVCLGSGTVLRDLAILAVPMQDYFLAGEPGEIAIKVYQSGLADAATNVIVRCASEQMTLPVKFNGQRMVELKAPVKQDEAGQYEYSILVEAVEGETERRNNSQTVFCDVTARRIKVLLIEGQPYWDTKFLAQALRKDERIELTQITQLSDRTARPIVTRASDDHVKVPQTIEELSQYSVVILGRDIERVLSAPSADVLVDFVSRQGGQLIFARGMAYEPTTLAGRTLADRLGELEPVDWGQRAHRDVTLALTSSGRFSNWLAVERMGWDLDAALARLPGFTVMPQGVREKAAAIVLMRAKSFDGLGSNPDEGEPALVSMSVGRGNVVAIVGEGLWQWSLLEKQKRDLAGLYDAFWCNLVRWLAMGGDFQPGEQVSLKLSRANVYAGEPLVIDVAYRLQQAADSHPVVLLSDPSGAKSDVAMHRLPGNESRFRATLKPTEPGVYEIMLVSSPAGAPSSHHTTSFSVHDVSPERLETSANPAAMTQLAQQTGGEAFKANQADLLLSKLERRWLATIVPTDPEFLWDQGWILFLLLTWCGLEWIIRRGTGLL